MLAKAREKGRQATCQAHLKQWATASLMYVQDCDSCFPMNLTDTSQPGQLVTFWDATLPYVRNKQILICPSEANPIDSALLQSALGGYRPSEAPWAESYLGNMAVFADGPSPFLTRVFGIPLPRPKAVTSDAAIGRPAESVMWSEARFSNQLTAPIAPRHNYAASFAFCDGHVKAVPASPMGVQYVDLRGLAQDEYGIGAGAYAYRGQFAVEGLVADDGRLHYNDGALVPGSP